MLSHHSATSITKHLLLFAIPAVLSLAFLVGCGGPPASLDDTDEGDIQSLVDELLDNANNRTKTEQMFVEGAAPTDEDRNRIKLMAIFIVADSIDFTSETEATFQVRLKNPTTGDNIGQPLNWSAEKVSEQWKLKDAPLPPGN